MRASAAIPLVLSLTAFILSMLCIFAGSKKGYLEEANLLTLNTSMLGRTTFNTSKTSSPTLNKIADKVKGEINEVVADIAKELNIHDFYSAHILDFCEGYYTSSAVSNATSHPSKNVTHCSNQTALFHFDPTAALQKELKPGVNLTSQLKWPEAIRDTIRAVEFSSKAMFVFYCMGAAATGLALMGALVGFMATGRLSAMINIMTSILASFTLMIASAISTAIINKVVDAINHHGNGIGVSATKGTTFIGMTWAATLLVLFSGVYWAIELIRGLREERKTCYKIET